MTIARKYLLIFGGVLFLGSALQVLRYFGQPADIWWTPKEMALPLAEASDRVEVYVRDVALPEQLEAGRVQLLTEAGPSRIAKSDVRVRLNNRDRIRAERIPLLIGAGIGLGVSATLMIFGVLGWGPTKRARAAEGD